MYAAAKIRIEKKEQCRRVENESQDPEFKCILKLRVILMSVKQLYWLRLYSSLNYNRCISNLGSCTGKQQQHYKCCYLCWQKCRNTILLLASLLWVFLFSRFLFWNRAITWIKWGSVKVCHLSWILVRCVSVWICSAVDRFDPPHWIQWNFFPSKQA